MSKPRSQSGQFARTHGLANTRTYHSWEQMHSRCSNPKTSGYENYGGRGITVCKRWTKFSAFLSDMGVRPEGHSLERKNRNSNYTPSNCVWATPTQQAFNRSTTRIVRVKGTRVSLKNAERILHIPDSTLLGNYIHEYS